MPLREFSVIGIPPQIKAVFFDVVGTVLFPTPPALTVYAEVARRGGLNLDEKEIRTNFIAAYKAEEIADRSAGWIASEEREKNRWRSIVAACLHGVSNFEFCFRQLFDYFAKPGSWSLNKEFARITTELKGRGIVVGLGSNYDSRLWPVIDGFPELSLLRERTVISSLVGFRKPAAEFFQKLIGMAACNPREVLFVGDDLENDYRGAIEAGLEARLLDPSNRHDVPDRIHRLMELIV